MDFVFKLMMFGVLFVFLGAGSAWCEPEYEEIDKIVATVDGEAFTLNDIKSKMRPMLSKLSASSSSENLSQQRIQLFHEGVRTLLFEEILEREAEASGIEVADEEIEAYMNEIRRQNNVDEKGFEKVLASRGISLEDYKREVRLDITRGRIISKRLAKKINIVDQDIDRYLLEHPELIPPKNSIRLYLVEYKFTDFPTLSREQLRDKLEQVRAKLLAGNKLREIEPRYFKDLGFVKRDELREDLAALVRGFSLGEVGEVSLVGQSFVLFEVAGEVGEEDSIDESVKSQVKDILFKERYEEEVTKFLNDELPKKYHVETKL